MFDIGFMEILMIGVVSLVVIGPERLPEVAAKVGKTVAKARRFVQGVRSDITRELEAGDLKKMIGDQKEQINELRKVVAAATTDIEKSTSNVLKDAESSFQEMQTEIKGDTDDIARYPESDLIDAEIAEDELHIEESKADIASDLAADTEADAAQIEHTRNTDDASDLSENKAS